MTTSWLPESQCREAIGYDHASKAIRRFLSPEMFTLLPRPTEKSSWLLKHDEVPQTFADMTRGQTRSRKRNMVPPERSTIYLVPVGAFVAGCSPSLELLRRYAELYFRLPVKLLPTISDGDVESDEKHNRIRSRRHHGVTQLLTDDILALLSERLPSDAFCLLGVTMTDLYPEPSWNFVLGIAHPKQKVGVFSFARYSPTFGKPQKDGGGLSASDHSSLLHSSLRVMVHELFHLFGADHCQFYSCVMQGTNSVEEEEAHPLELCPVCLHKLHYVLQAVVPELDLLQRYVDLQIFYSTLPTALQVAFAKDRQWLEARIKSLQSQTKRNE